MSEAQRVTSEAPSGLPPEPPKRHEPTHRLSLGHLLHQSLRMTARDWRAGELTMLLLALVLAVAALSSVGFLIVVSWVLPRLWRGVQGGFRGMATHMVSRLARSRHD